MLDTWGPNNGYAGEAGCEKREVDLNSWCGTTDIVTYFVPYAVAPPPSVPPVPTEPEGGCYYFYPSGCPAGDGSGPSTAWVLDTWGPDNGYAGEAGCEKRGVDLNSWCGTTDIITYFVPYAVAPPPPEPLPFPPSPPPTPITGVPFADEDCQNKILLAFNSSFKHTPLLVRYPDTLGTYSPPDLRIGFHDDSFTQATIDYTGYLSYFFMDRMAAANALTRYYSVPIGGEERPELADCIFEENIEASCPLVDGVAAQDFDACVTATHSSWQWDNEILVYTGADLTRALDSASKMGVQYYLTKLTVLYDGTSFSLSAQVTNTGNAPTYYDVAMELSYPCGTAGTNVTFPSKALSSLMPGASTSLTSPSVAQSSGVTQACVFLTSPNAVKNIKFAVVEMLEGEDVVRFDV